MWVVQILLAIRYWPKWDKMMWHRTHERRCQVKCVKEGCCCVVEIPVNKPAGKITLQCKKRSEWFHWKSLFWKELTQHYNDREYSLNLTCSASPANTYFQFSLSSSDTKFSDETFIKLWSGNEMELSLYVSYWLGLFCLQRNVGQSWLFLT